MVEWFAGSSPRHSGGHSLDINGKHIPLYPPDDFNESMVKTDPPQQRLKLEWMWVSW